MVSAVIMNDSNTGRSDNKTINNLLDARCVLGRCIQQLEKSKLKMSSEKISYRIYEEAKSLESVINAKIKVEEQLR